MAHYKIYTMAAMIKEIAECPWFGKIVCTSGGFDPIHPGHISCIQKSKLCGDFLIVLVNGDEFLRRKKGKPFMDVRTRTAIVAALSGVDAVVPLTGEHDQDTVTEALRLLKPQVFTKGGDRCDEQSIPEWNVCRELDIQIATGVGADKAWSSSDFLQDWVEFKRV